MKTETKQTLDTDKKWFVVNAQDYVLGRLASRISLVLRGKHKATFAPHLDNGDFVIVVNADKIQLTGNKLTQKMYYRHTGYPGGIRGTTAAALLAKYPERVIYSAVRGMLPKNRLGRQMLKKLKVYAGNDHPHAAQQPETLTI
jgi:large subunit ribosomal protein L13